MRLRRALRPARGQHGEAGWTGGGALGLCGGTCPRPGRLRAAACPASARAGGDVLCIPGGGQAGRHREKGANPRLSPPARCSAPAGRAGPGPRPRPGGAGRCGRAAAGLPAERAQPQPRHEGGEAGPPAPGTPRVARGRGRVPPRRAEAPRGGGSGASLRGPRSTRKGVVQSCRRVTGRCVCVEGGGSRRSVLAPFCGRCRGRCLGRPGRCCGEPPPGPSRSQKGSVTPCVCGGGVPLLGG